MGRRKIGTLIIGSGSLSSKGGKRQITKRIPWSRFAAMMDELADKYAGIAVLRLPSPALHKKCSTSEPRAVATGHTLSFGDVHFGKLVVFQVASVAGRYGSRF
ncbi:MAG TPA: hypothetical protein VMZ30_12215 [Pyrinomonadaceae bacterium]|nr:hypothetical protein [Pyrinomonadaceae bacterium]